MKRNELVDKLVNEGLSVKTLSKLTDNQLNILGSRMLGEQMKKGDVVVPTNTDPNKIKQLTAQGLDVALVNKPATEGEVSEELKGGQKKLDKNHNGKIDGQDFKILQGQKKKKETNEIGGKNIEAKDKKLTVSEEKPSAGLSKEKKSEVVKKAKSSGDIGKKGKRIEKIANKAAEKYGSKEKGEKVAAAAMWKNVKRESVEKKSWIKNLVENEFFHNFTSKGEIMDLIQTKLNENQTMVQHGSKVKKGHNGIPEFMSYDVLTAAEPKTAPAKPKVAPGTKPSPGKSPAPKHPYAPGPAEKPEPKAQMGEDNAPAKDPKIKEAPKKQDKPGHPYQDPSKKDKPERKA